MTEGNQNFIFFKVRGTGTGFGELNQFNVRTLCISDLEHPLHTTPSVSIGLQRDTDLKIRIYLGDFYIYPDDTR